MSEWNKVKLDDCLELITYGFTNPMPDTAVGPWKVTAKDIINGKIDYDSARHTSEEAFENDLTDKSRPLKDDILLTKDGTLGRLAIVGDEKICINQSVALLRVKKDIVYVPFLYYLLSTPLFQGMMLADAGGATIKHIYITRVNQLSIPLPPYEQQIIIANNLSRYDSLIGNYQKQIKLLEEAAQRLYKEWFVDLRFPGHEKTKIVDGVPEGWEKKKTGDITPIITGKKDANFSTPDGAFPFFTCSQEPIKAPSYSFDTNAVILAGNGDFNVKLYRGKFEAYQRTYVLEPNNPSMLYLLYFCISENMNKLATGASGSTIKFLTKGMIDSLEMLVPTSIIVSLFNQYVEAIQSKKESIQSQFYLLTEARDRLLPKLMSGEITV